MNLLQFTWRTAKMLFAIPVGFGYGVVQQLLDGEPMAALIAGLVGALLFAVALLMTEGHRRTLDRRNMTGYVRAMIHNKDTFPFTLPSETQAVAEVGELFDNPLKP